MSKRDNFKRVSSKRVIKLKSDLLRFCNFNNSQYYAFKTDDILSIYREIKTTLDLVFVTLVLRKSRSFKL